MPAFSASEATAPVPAFSAAEATAPVPVFSASEATAAVPAFSASEATAPVPGWSRPKATAPSLAPQDSFILALQQSPPRVQAWPSDHTTLPPALPLHLPPPPPWHALASSSYVTVYLLGDATVQV